MRAYVSQWMSKTLANAGPNQPLFEALEIMGTKGVRHVLVVDEQERALGIVSNRDVVRSAMRNPERRLEFFACKLRHVMTATPLFTTSGGATLAEAAALMHEHKVSALPVLEDGALRGLITSDDILASVSRPETALRRPDL